MTGDDFRFQLSELETAFDATTTQGTRIAPEPQSHNLRAMLRRFTDDDLDELLDVWYRASLVAHPFLSEEFLQSERREIAEHWLSLAETTVYESDGKVIGFLALIGNEVGAIFVDPEWHSRGVGRALMDDARGRRSFLELNVFEANAVGRRFYDAYGFELVDRHVHEPSGQTKLRLRLV